MMMCFVQHKICSVCMPLYLLCLHSILCLHSMSEREAVNLVDENELLVSNIIETVSGVCPAKVCYVASDGPRNTSLDLKQCCGGCSCEADCDHRSDSKCCFEPAVKPYDEECLIPSTGTPDPNNLDKYIRYLMISSCPLSSNSLLTGDTQLASCQNTSLAPWGSFYPVYSYSTKTFYLNEACAVCNRDYNTTAWTPVLSCVSNNKNTDVDKLTQFYLWENIYDTCQINFIPPVVSLDILERKKCYKHYIDKCYRHEFIIPPEVNLTKSEVIRACESSFLSPFVGISVGLYKNVFCYICNAGPYFNSWTRCETFFEDHPYLSKQMFAYTSFIDLDLLQTMPRVSKMSKYMLACNKNKTVCHEVHCPSARLRMGYGGCIFPKELWTFNRYTVVLKLTPTTELNGIQDSSWQHFIDHIINPWPKEWKIRKIALNVSQDSKTIDYILIEIRLEYLVKKPERLLHAVSKHSSLPWYYMNNGNKLELLSDFSPFKSIQILRGQLVPEFTRFTDKRSNVSEITWFNTMYSYVLDSMQMDAVILSKMFFCDQVELDEKDYIILHGSQVVYFIPTQRYFFDGEFVFLRTDQRRRVHIRICLEDSGLQLQASNNVGRGCTTHVFSSLVVTVVLVMMFYISM